MEKELFSIEFRYRDVPKGEWDSSHKSTTITIGVYDTLDDAVAAGNNALEVFEKHFKLNTAWNRKDRFGKSNGCFGMANRLITSRAYLQTPFDFYAKITKLTYKDVDQTITEVLHAIERHKALND